MSKSRDQLNEYLKQINIEGKVVLDVGVQDKPTIRMTKGHPSEFYTLDIDPQWKPDIVADLNLAATIDLVKKISNKEVVDVIFCIEVLEHCWNPVQVVENLSLLLKPGGVVYISTPFINPHHDYVDYLRYTNEWYRDVLPKVGLEVVRIEERAATAGKAMLNAFYQQEGLRVSKIRPEFGRYTFPIGYFVEAKKI